MDNYTEQLVSKKPDFRDISLRFLILSCTLLLIVLSIVGMLMFGITLLVLVAVGAVYLAYFLFALTQLEYEYIVTNNDLDIDKVMGKRKRKRLVSVKLNTVESLSPYDPNVKSNATSTVMATDGLGVNMWIMTAKHEKYGNLQVLFTPNERTLACINSSLPYSARCKQIKKLEEIAD